MKSRYISRNGELERCISLLSETQELAIDLEFDKNRFRYGFNLCLVQIYAAGECFLIDPLSRNLDIERLFPVLEDESIRKVVFAFGEDMRLLHSMGCFPQNIFDLKIATSLLNYPPASLNNLLKEILNVDTGKSSQKSNWYARPLSNEQRMYAANDVLYLLELKEVLHREAVSRNIDSWIREENARLDELDFSDAEDSTFIKKKDKQGMSEYEWYLFRKLLEFREELARRYNRPNYQIIDKKYLESVARGERTLADWQDVRGIYRSVKTPATLEKISRLLENSCRKARQMGLSKDKPAVKPLSREEFQVQKKERTRINRIKNDFFIPIKTRIAEDYGDEAACFMFSNRFITNIIAGKVDSLESYKKELIEDYARELNKDVEPILSSVN